MATPVERWVEEQARLFQPKRIHWCDGSEAEAFRLIETGMREEKIGAEPIFRELNGRLCPTSTAAIRPTSPGPSS
jgi:GTP-dependent phosphoenolpyruvate carboxykinase